jgi:hypothetical protein
MADQESISPLQAPAANTRPAVPAEEQPPEISDPAFNEDSALALLQRPDLPVKIIEQLSKNGFAMKSRKVKLAVACHPKTPPHVSLPLIRQLFTFDLMKLALMPLVAADVKKAAEDALINRLDSITLGERISLARRASGRVAGALLRDRDPRVATPALENDRLTESLLIQAISRHGNTPEMVGLVCRNPKWSCRKGIRVALLRNEHTPLAQAIEFARSFSAAQLEEILAGSRFPTNITEFLLQDLARRYAAPPDAPESTESH